MLSVVLDEYPPHAECAANISRYVGEDIQLKGTIADVLSGLEAIEEGDKTGNLKNAVIKVGNNDEIDLYFL